MRAGDSPFSQQGRRCSAGGQMLAVEMHHLSGSQPTWLWKWAICFVSQVCRSPFLFLDIMVYCSFTSFTSEDSCSLGLDRLPGCLQSLFFVSHFLGLVVLLAGRFVELRVGSVSHLSKVNRTCVKISKCPRAQILCSHSPSFISSLRGS